MFALKGTAARRSLFFTRNSKLPSASSSRLLLHTAPFSSNVNETCRPQQTYFLKKLDRRASRTLSERYDEIILSKGPFTFELNADCVRTPIEMDNKSSEAVINLYEEMLEQGLKPANKTVSDIIIPSFVILDRYKAAVPLCDQLCAAGVKPATEAGWFWAEAYWKSDRMSNVHAVLNSTAEQPQLSSLRYFSQVEATMDVGDVKAGMRLIEIRNMINKDNARQLATDQKSVTIIASDAATASTTDELLHLWSLHCLAGDVHSAVATLDRCKLWSRKANGGVYGLTLKLCMIQKERVLSVKVL
jgi:hypothetical protein